MRTRFNPTTNGDLHLGHIYMALVNQHMAEGDFILRFDDNSRHIMAEHGDMREIADRQLATLRRMGLEPTELVYQSDLEQDVKRFLAQSKFQMVIDHAFEGMRDTQPVVHGPIVPMRLSAWIVAERVVLDQWANIDTVIRGMDLLQNHTLYMYFCALFGFDFPRCYYLPRLADRNGNGISKTDGNWVVDRLDGSAADTLELLRRACLVDPAGPWHVDNVKLEPRL